MNTAAHIEAELQQIVLPSHATQRDGAKAILSAVGLWNEGCEHNHRIGEGSPLTERCVNAGCLWTITNDAMLTQQLHNTIYKQPAWFPTSEGFRLDSVCTRNIMDTIRMHAANRTTTSCPALEAWARDSI